MTIEELNALLEAISNAPTDDALRLDNFGKIRNAYESVLNEIAEVKASLDKLSVDYDNLKGVKTKEFFAPVEKTDEKAEEKEEKIDENNDGEVTIDELFKDDVEVVDNI